MPDYSKSLIYQIKCLETGEVYIGSTTQTLERRIIEHKKPFSLKRKVTFSTSIIERGNYKVDVLLYCSCKDRKELNRIEGNFIIAEPNSINKVVAGRTNKQYKEEHKEKYKIYYRKIYEENKEKKHLMDKVRREWTNSWCGDPRYYNNLLSIKV